jgi:hypothetical protein
VAWGRIQVRNAALDRGFYIAPDTFSMLKARFQPLDDDEARIEVSQNV